MPTKPSLKGNNWVVDASHCQGCSSQFTFINRKHHCRRCGGLFCNSCTQQRLYLRGQGDSAVRICEPCKKLEEAARFEMRHGHKNRAGKGGSKVASKYEDEVLNQILGNDRKESVSSGQESSDVLLSLQRATSSGSCSNVKEVNPQKVGEEIHRSFSENVHNSLLTDFESASPDELRQQAVDEKKKYKILKAEGKPEEALRAFKRGKELERQAGALELELRKNRRKAMVSITMNEIQKPKDEAGESGRKSNSPEISKKKDDLSSELRELGWSELDLHDADKKPVNMTLEGELSTLLREVSQKTNNTEKVTHGIDKSEVIALKKRALALKREGKLGEAKEELKRAKILEKQIEEQEFMVGAEESDDELSSLIRSMDNDKKDDLLIINDADREFNFSHLLSVDDGLGADINFEVTDEDMYDPDIAAALQSLGWSEDTSQQDEIDPQIVPVDREAMLSEIQSLKREAVNKKRAGNTAEAMALLKKAKALEADLDSYDSDHNDPVAQNSTTDRQKGSISQPAESSSKPHMGHKMAPKNKLAIQRELLAVKKKALALRREGRSDEAEEELKKGKALEQQLEEMDNASELKVTQVNVGNKHADINIAMDVEDEGDVTDQDMNDPSYLSLLQNLGWKEDDSEKFQSSPKEKDTHTANSTHAQVPTVAHIGASRRSKGEIQRELLGLKRKSLALRRQGEVDEAEEVLRMARVLEAQLAEMEAPKAEVPAELEKPKDVAVNSSLQNLIDENVGVQLVEKIPLVVLQENPIKGLGTKEYTLQPTRVEIVHVSEKPQISESNSLQQEILAHKRKAISLKREGRLAEAKEELRQAKLLEKSTEDKKTEPSTSSSSVTSFDVVDPIGKKEQNLSSAPKLSSRDRFKMQQESLGHKRQALKLRREGRLQEAEAEFELAKALETQLEELTANDSTKTSAEPTDDVGVEDLLDPQLLSALREIGIENSTTVAPIPERAKPVKPVAVILENPNEERFQLEERIKAEKVKAVNLKRSGKQAEAVDALRRAKLLEKKLNSLAS